MRSVRPKRKPPNTWPLLGQVLDPIFAVITSCAFSAFSGCVRCIYATENGIYFLSVKRQSDTNLFFYAYILFIKKQNILFIKK